MTEIQIKRFFEAYGYKVNTIALDNGRIIDVFNPFFKVNEGIDGRLYFEGMDSDLSKLKYDFDYSPVNLYNMIMDGWSFTHSHLTIS